jgi:F-type H+-transporting ATPase subunit b
MLRSLPTVLVLLLALALAGAAPPRAAANEPPAGGAKDEGKADLFTPPRLDLTIWTIVVFGILLWVLRKLAWNPMLQGLHGRESRIRGALDEAQTARDEAHRLRDQLRAEMDAIQDKMRAMLDEARRGGEQLKERLLAEATAEVEKGKERARRDIALEGEKAKQELWSQLAQLATLVSAKAIGRHMTPDDHRGLVDEAVAEMNNAAAQRPTA